MCGKLGVFRPRRGQGWKLVVGLVPLVVALMVALSRTTDYHHHWQGTAGVVVWCGGGGGGVAIYIIIILCGVVLRCFVIIVLGEN